MNKNYSTFKMILSSFFLVLAIILPFFTGQIPEIGQMLCPLHIPILLCGFICGWKYGLLTGFIAPLLRSLIFGAPPLYPSALAMAFELAIYGLMTGILYYLLPKNKINIYLSLISSMIIGRIVWGFSMFILLEVKGGTFTFSSFMAGALINAIPGIIIQIILIPFIIMIVEPRIKKIN